MSEQTNEHDLIEMTAGADTLAWDIFRADNSRLPEELLRADFPANAEYALNIAKHLREAGYRKPRTVTTPEELDALPVGSVIRTAGHAGDEPRIAVKDGFWKTESEWFVADGSEWCLDSSELDDLPATVLLEGRAS